MTNIANIASLVTRQEQEALSRRHNYSAVVVPLSTGEFAIFSSDLTSESMLIVDNADDLSLAIVSRASMHDRKTPSKGRPVDLNMKGLLD